MAGVEEISSKYASELNELRCNSKPLINSLTMMAEDYIRHAPVIVQTIENHLRRVKPELKLPVLYLIDSIVKNVKKEYVDLFTVNIVSTFTLTFEQVNEKIKSQMWKLRQTWNDVFQTKKLYSIDYKCHQTDPGWPITAAPPSTASIHVNPKFLRTLTSTSGTPTVVNSTVASLSSAAPNLTASALSELGIPHVPAFSMEPPGDVTEAQMREQLLMKQKELLELQTKKLELELLHTKAQLEERTRKQNELINKQQPVEAQTMQQQLMQQVEMAKHQTDLATTLLSKVTTAGGAMTSGTVPSLTVSTPSFPSITTTAASSSTVTATTLSTATSQPSAVAMQDPRKRRDKDKDRVERDRTESKTKHRHSHSSHHKAEVSPPELAPPRLPRSAPSQLTTACNATISHVIHPIGITQLPPTSRATLTIPPATPLPDPRQRVTPEKSAKFSRVDRSPSKDKDNTVQNVSANVAGHRSRSSPQSSSSDPRQKSLSPGMEKDRPKEPPVPVSLFDVNLFSDPRKRKLKDVKSGLAHQEKSPSKGSRERVSRDRSGSAGSSNGTGTGGAGTKRSGSVGRTPPVPLIDLSTSTGPEETKSEIPAKRRKKSGESGGLGSTREKDKDYKEISNKEKRIGKVGKSSSSSSSSSRHERDSTSTKGSSKEKEGGEREGKSRHGTKDEYSNLRNRKKSVLMRNYRRTTEVANMDEEEENKTKVTPAPWKQQRDKEDHGHGHRIAHVVKDIGTGTGGGVGGVIVMGKGKDDLFEVNDLSLSSTGVSSSLGPPKVVGSDVDFRFESLQDVDLRSRTTLSGPGGEPMIVDSSGSGSGGDQSPLKKPRNGNLIDDLFGREDVDLRQQSSGSSSWSQMKNQSVSLDMGGGESPMDIVGKDPRILISSSAELDLLPDRPRPPPTISPANSIDSNRSSCDPLGRPLLYNRLPDDPAERKRSLDFRTSSIDPVDRFRAQYIERAAIGGDLSNADLKKAVVQAQHEFEMHYFTKDQYDVIMRQLMQINEVNKIREVQQMQQVRGPNNMVPGPNPWTESSDVWSQFSGRGPGDFGQGQGQGRFPTPINTGTSVWGAPPMPMNWGQQQPRGPSGPNPFEEAAAAAAAIIPATMLDDLLPPVNRLELDIVKRDTSGTIPIDKVMRQVRFYDETAIVLQGSFLGDEPREISFQKSIPKNVWIDQEREPVRCFIGKPFLIYLDRKKHNLKLGAPTREFYIDGDHYEGCFGGPPVRVRVDRYFHTFKLEGPPPQVEVGKVLRYDLLAGRVNLFIDGNSMAVYLDEKPQLIDVCGFPVILRFCDGFHTVLLNGRPFPTDFGGLPMSVTVPGGRKHYLRLSGLSPSTKRAMLHFVRAKTGPGRGDLQDGHPMTDGFPGAFRGRGGRGGRGGPMIMGRGGNRPPLFNMAPMMPPMGVGMDGIRHPLPPGTDMYPPMAPLTFETNSNPLDALANIMPSPSGENYSNENSENHRYEIETPVAERGGMDEEMTAQNKEPLDVQDLLSKLMMAGLLPAATVPETGGGAKIEEILDDNKTEEPKKVGKEPVDEPKESSKSKSKEKLVKKEVKVKHKEKEEPAEKIIPPLETVDVSWNGLKERHDKLIAQICTGVQCGSCGLRFPPDQNVRYSQHLDWHFRQNRREKVNARVALSRKWYYDLSDWIQFAEIEDLEDRAQSLFEPLETDLEEQRSPGTVLNPDHYTVLSAGYEGAVCPQCNEGFESFFDEEKEEWRLRDAFVADGDETEAATLYHPICHQDFMAALQGKSTLLDVSPKEEEPKSESGKGEAVDEDVVMESAEAEAEAGGDDDEEVLILKEGKPEPEVMDIDMAEEEDEVTAVEPEPEESSSVAESGMDACESDSITKKSVTENVIVEDKDTRKDSDDQNDESMICIDVDDDDNNNAELNNKTETQLQLERDTPDETTSSGTTQTHNIDIEPNTDTHSRSEVQKPHEINLADSSNSNSNSTLFSSTNISVNILSSLGGGSGGEEIGSPATITIPDDEEGASLFQSIHGQVFDIALGNSSQGFPSPRPETESPPTDHKRIIYASMKFDNPTPKIKIEPLDPDEEDDGGGSSFDFIMKSNLEPIEVNLEEESPDEPPTATSTVPPTEATAAPGVDIDLTGDDDETMDATSLSAHSALDGNFQFSDQAPSHQIAPISKIRIRITDAVLSTDSQSPKNSPARTNNEDEAPSAAESTKVPPAPATVVPPVVPPVETDPQTSKSPTQTEAADEDGGMESSGGGVGVVKKGIVHNIVLSSSSSSNVNLDNAERKERMDRLKPKLIDRKLVNYPPKQTGKEVSGLCTIS